MTGALVNAASSDQWRSRSIYQLLTDRYARSDSSTSATCNVADGNYCGGTWRGIINNLDYIQDMGFTAIWISPVTYNLPERTVYGHAYHGFWQQDLYRLNENFGTKDDLKALSKALHSRGMYLMVDVVTNHHGWNGSATTVDFSRFHPFNEAKYYHSYCAVRDYSDPVQVENCWIGDTNVSLPDLRTEDQAVTDEYSKWIRGLVSNYSIDGLRIDTVKYVNKPFWSSFSQAADVFCTGEVLARNQEYTCDYQKYMHSVLNYPLYYPMMAFLNSTSGTPVPLIKAIDLLKRDCKDVTLLATFSENHDIPRFASQTQDMSLAKNILALTLLWDGIPIVYAGQEQHYAGYGDPGNREATWLAKYSRRSNLFRLVAVVNRVRNHAISIDGTYLAYNIHAIYNDTNTLALRKGHSGRQIISVLTNSGVSSPVSTLKLGNTGWRSGTVIYEILTCMQITVSNDGTLHVPMEKGLPRIYFAKAAAQGSRLCAVVAAAAGAM
ncbi:glycoside hydrolase superfamily [Massariosphaeria phaeospora]|uniref:alpha-amylase n=1 Tax=Massariosphaeria phaeospora TaxID=100035 RepID=A0A7C8IAF7_9PLEO|nr:glycoside hydrolase superfamily [Massariosphaeria phaeospora]